ncbi:MAG: hypothetical protein ABL962_02705 [Fimbriimonadaceae bacterium]
METTLMVKVVLIDTENAPINLRAGFRLETFHPMEATIAPLVEANLVLVDFMITDWASKTDARIPELARPSDGLALAHSIRRILEQEGDKCPPAVALMTSEYEEAAKPLPRSILPHLLARLNGIEWVFEKTDGRDGVEALASASNPDLYAIVRQGTAEEKLVALARYLGVPDTTDCTYILDEIDFCQPPIHDLYGWEHGLLILRWLIHRVLPYPTMLVGDSYVAERAQCKLGDLSEAVSRKNDAGFLTSKYVGAASEMFTRRFWRCLLERYLYQKLGDSASDPSRVRALLCEELEFELEVAPEPQVECLDNSGRYGNCCAPMSQVKQILIDDWPPFATPAFSCYE